MGIRIHKTIGYGRTDVKTEKHNLVDDRINLKAFEDLAYSMSSHSTEQYLRFLYKYKQNIKTVVDMPMHDIAAADYVYPSKSIEQVDSVTSLEYSRYRARELKQWDPSNSIIFEPEFGLPSVLVLVPFFCYKEWHRYDDSIDYIEATNLESYAPKVTELTRGIYPYDYFYRDTRTGASISSNNINHFDLVEKLKNGEIIPRVPAEIRALASYLKLFNDPNQAELLKPLLYVYWS